MPRGQLRIYLGAAPGVGKTFAMLDEGWRRRQRGTDVVVGYVETHGRQNTADQIRDLEVVPRRVLEYRGTRFEEMDLDAVLARGADVVLVDELAHTNVPGSRHAKRWEDVDALLDAGIDVITTVNVQHLESLNDVVEEITGVQQMETVPDEIVRAADQIELVDMTPEALRRRMAHGNIYRPDKVDAALANYFRVGNLAALRELALLWTADRVDEALTEYREAHGISRPWETRERIVVAVTGAPSGGDLIRRAARIAGRAHGDLLGVHIRPDDGLDGGEGELGEHRRLLADLGGVYHEVVGSDPAAALVGFAMAENATQLVLGSSSKGRVRELTQGSVINRVIRSAGAIDVHVISGAEATSGHGDRRALPTRRRPRALTRQRRLAGWGLAAVAIPLLTAILLVFDESLNLPAEMLLFLLAVTAVALVGGAWPAITAAVVASIVVNWFFTEPTRTLTIAEAGNVVALIVFVAVAGTVSILVSTVARRSADAIRSRTEAEAIATVAGAMLDADDPLAAAVTHIRSTFGLVAVAVLRPDGDGWTVEASSGEPVPRAPNGRVHLDLRDDVLLVMEGPALHSDDLRVMGAFLAQVDTALEHRRLRRDAADAAATAEGDRLRTAILRAVSHDLRTPLASIKASVTSLRQTDVDWSPHDRTEFLATIEEETDRLNQLVGNLLDMSRLETGIVQPALRAVGLEDVVPRALMSLSRDAGSDTPEAAVTVAISEELPPVVADAELLERVVANLVTNALTHARPTDHHPVRIEAGRVGSRVDLRVVDHGRGLPERDRHAMFEPFQRMGDGASGSGVGLGLAVSKGFVDAMGGELTVDDTPGGGLTFTISLPVAP